MGILKKVVVFSATEEEGVQNKDLFLAKLKSGSVHLAGYESLWKVTFFCTFKEKLNDNKSEFNLIMIMMMMTITTTMMMMAMMMMMMMVVITLSLTGLTSN